MQFFSIANQRYVVFIEMMSSYLITSETRVEFSLYFEKVNYEKKMKTMSSLFFWMTQGFSEGVY